MQESLGNQRGSTKMWTQKERMYLSQEKMGERRAGRQRKELCYSASKGKPCQVRQLAQEKQNKTGKYRGTAFWRGISLLPRTLCSAEWAEKPSLLHSFLLFLPSSLFPLSPTLQATGIQREISQTYLHLCKAAKKQHPVKKSLFNKIQNSLESTDEQPSDLTLEDIEYWLTFTSGHRQGSLSLAIRRNFFMK